MTATAASRSTTDRYPGVPAAARCAEVLEGPAGRLLVGLDAGGRPFAEWTRRPVGPVASEAPLPAGLRRRLATALEGGAADFRDLPLPEGPDFHLRCWRALLDVPAGRTVTYAELAERAGAPRGAARAVGQAMRRNPAPVIVPCHRVLAAGGPGGYSGVTDPAREPLRRKLGLLALEREAAGADAS